MQDERKTKAQLLGELRTSRAKLKKLRSSEDARKRLLISLKESELRFRLLFDHAPLAYQSLDPDGNFIDVNHAWLGMFGYAREQVIGRWFGEFLAPEHVDEFRRRFSEFKSCGQIHAEFELVHNNGFPKFIAFEGRIGYDLKGKFKQAHCILQDITKRRRAQDALRESEERYRDLVEHSLDLICTHDLEGNLRSVNPAATTLSGFTQEELVGKNLHDFLAPETRSLFQHYLARIQAKGSDKGVIHVITKSGERKIWEFFNTLRTEEGQAPLVRGVARDVTERKRVEKALEASEHRLREVLVNSPDTIYVLDLITGKINFLNRERFCGFSKQELQSPGSILDSVHPDDLATVKANWARIMDGGDADAVDYRLRQKEGPFVWIGQRATVVARDTRGAPARLLVTLTDISMRKRAEEALEKSHLKLQLALDAAQIGIFNWDMLTDSMTWDGRIYEFWGLPEGTRVTRQIFLQGVHQDDRERVKASFDTFEGQQCHARYRTEYRVIGIQTGIERWLEVAGQVSSSKGLLVHFVGTMMDITARRQLEENLERSEKDYRSLANLSPDLIARFDRQCRHLFVNPTAASAGVISADEYVGKTIGETGVPEQEAKKWERCIKTVFETGRMMQVQDSFVTPQGLCYFDTKFVPELEPDGSIRSVLSFAREITESERTKRALRESEERYRRLVEQSPDAIAVYSEGTIQYVNPAAVSLFGGQNREDLLGRSMVDFVHPESRADIARRDEELARGIGSPLLEEKLVKLDGTAFRADVIAIPTRYGDRNAVQIIVRDITPRKQVEGQLVALQQQLRMLAGHLQRVREEERKHLSQEFHDQLGQLLTALKMDLAMLGRAISDPRSELPRNVIIIGVESMQDMIDKAINIIREIMSELRPEMLDQLGILPTLEWEVERFRRKSGISCAFRSTEQEFNLASSSAIALYRIFQEAIANVARHARATRVDVELRKENDLIVLEIKDDGIGISADAAGRVNSFGLIGMRERAIMLGGSMEVHGVEGGGTTVVVRLPDRQSPFEGGNPT